MTKIAVFASGNGSNFQAIINSIERGELQAEIMYVVCDKKEAYAIERAKQHNISTFVFDAKEYPNKAAFEREIVHLLQEVGVEWIALAGYMRLIGETLLEAYEGRIINLHPSLLPSFPGKDAIGQAFRKGVKITGATIHYVDAGMDTGPIIAQAAVMVEEQETLESLEKKIHNIEHTLYVNTLKALLHTKVGNK